MIDAAQPKGSRYVLWDSEVVGLGLSVHPTGRKVFVLKYRTRDGMQRKPALGPYGALTLHQARDLAKGMLHQVYAGADPATERAAARSAPTLAEVWGRFSEQPVARKKRTTRLQYEGIATKHLL
ncbi:MAG: Arm DNA-binding domain-containing protein, partial [Polyangiales bacterium]